MMVIVKKNKTILCEYKKLRYDFFRTSVWTPEQRLPLLLLLLSCVCVALKQRPL